MKRRRSPMQTLLITVAVAGGLILGTRVIAHARGDSEDQRRDQHLPDIALVDASADDLSAAGFQSQKTSPTTWSNISLRLFENETGFINCVRCTISPEEADKLVAFPVGSRVPANGLPPTDWPGMQAVAAEPIADPTADPTADPIAESATNPAAKKTGLSDPFMVPSWWQPSGQGSSRFYEEVPEGALSRGVYAHYDPATQVLHAYMWARADWQPTRKAEDLSFVADGIAHSLADLAVRTGWPADEQGWLAKQGLSTLDVAPVAAVVPAGVERIDVTLLPIQGRHRYLFRLSGIPQESISQVFAGLPMRPGVQNSAAPNWEFAQPEDGLPEWMNVGDGPRWHHVLRRVGTGQVEAARWAAYNPTTKSLVVWDWTDTPARPAADVHFP